LVKVVDYLYKPYKAAPGLRTKSADLLKVAQGVLSAAPAGVRDTDVQVRILSLDAVTQSANATTDLVLAGYFAKDFPAEGKTLTDEEKERVLIAQKNVRDNLETVQPLFESLRGTTGAILPSLDAPTATVRVAALGALESIAGARLKMKRAV